MEAIRVTDFVQSKHNKSTAFCEVTVGKIQDKIAITGDKLEIANKLREIEQFVEVSYANIIADYKVWWSDLLKSKLHLNLEKYDANCFVKYRNNVLISELKLYKLSLTRDEVTADFNGIVSLFYKSFEIKFSDIVYSGSGFMDRGHKTNLCFVVDCDLTGYKKKRFSTIDNAIKYIDKKLEENAASKLKKLTEEEIKSQLINDRVDTLQDALGYVVTHNSEYKSNRYGNSGKIHSYTVDTYSIKIGERIMLVNCNTNNNTFTVANIGDLTKEQAVQILNVLK